MALTFADLFGPAVEMIGLDATAKAKVLSTETAKQGWPASGSAIATSEYEAAVDAGTDVYDSIILGEGATQDAVVSWFDTAWLQMAARYIRDNDTTYDAVAPTWQHLAPILNVAMEVDDEDVDASVPSYGTVAYGKNNQGAGTATIAANSDTGLAELALAGVIELRCTTAGFDNQNAERWSLTWRGIDPRTGRELTRTSPTAARYLKTGTRFFDVAASIRPGDGISPSIFHIVPQRGSSIHTGSNILISVPTYTPTESGGDVDLCMSNVSVNLVDGAKSNLSKRNTTLLSLGSNRAFYLRIVKDGSDYNFTWYQDSSLTVALTETLTLTTSSGDTTYTWKAAATNPEHQQFGGHLTTDLNFISATVTASLLTQTTTVSYSAPLPFAVGDTITVPVTNAYAGKISRFFVEELGFPLRVIADTTETIADPA